MAEYVMRFRFPAPDDDHALRRATAWCTTFVAEWEENGVEWEGVQRADGTRVQPQPGEPDPVLVCAAWGGQARTIESDEDMEQVVSRVLAALHQTNHTYPITGHPYQGEGPGHPCTAHGYGVVCGEQWEDHTTGQRTTPLLSDEDLRGGFWPGMTGGLCTPCHLSVVRVGHPDPDHPECVAKHRENERKREEESRG